MGIVLTSPMEKKYTKHIMEARGLRKDKKCEKGSKEHALVLKEI